MGDEEGGALRGVPLPCEDAASLWSCLAAGSGGLLGTFALRCDERRGVADCELRWRRCPGEDIVLLLLTLFGGIELCHEL
jgi:hypothetical protein